MKPLKVSDTVDGFTSFTGGVAGSPVSFMLSYGENPGDSPDDDLMVAVNWRDGNRDDLRLEVLLPGGTTVVADGHALQNYEVVALNGPLDPGPYEFTIGNNHGRMVNFRGWVRFR